jgi:hypothetical protein
MADGTQKPIGKVQIGDQVFNHDKTEINTVTFVIGAIYTGELCSPSAQVAPFGSPQHPMIIDGKAYSYDVEHTKNEYPWLGDIQPLNKAATAQVVRKPVVNLLVTGDGTYRANGFGTTAVMGDGGNLVKRWQNGEISILEVYGTLRRYHNMGGLPLLEFYHTNKL